MSESIKEYIRENLPHIVKKMQQDVKEATEQDIQAIRSAVYNNNFVPDKANSIIVSCQLNGYRPFKSSQWKEIYLDEIRKIFWNEGLILTKIDFSMYQKGEKKYTEIEVFFILSN